MSIGVSTTHLKNTTPSSIFYQASSQFKFLVMTEINIFFYNFFLSLNISVFSLFLIQKLQPPHPHPPPRKESPHLSQQRPSKKWDPVKPSHFSKFSRRLNPPNRKWGGGTAWSWSELKDNEYNYPSRTVHFTKLYWNKN